MKRIKLSFIFILAMLTLLWLLGNPILFLPFERNSLHLAIVNYTGLMAIGIISICMVLSVRVTWINAFLGGLDKSYRLHKWLGIAGLIIAITHWGLVNFPKWFFGWEAITPPPTQLNPILNLFQNLYHVATEIGDLDFKLFVILVVLALVKKFPYRYFFKTHRFLAIVYLLLVIHSLVLMKFSYWHQAIAPVIVVLILAGTVAAFISLSRKIGQKRRVVGVIDELLCLKQSNVLKVVIEFKDRWPGHLSGQFAFVTFDVKEGPHPFTISSPWIDNGKIFFLIKGLGDYTKGLQHKLNSGDYVEIEGPYGQFNFNSKKDRQIWVAAGIGIAPFVARLKNLVKEGGNKEKTIDLFYTYNEIDEALLGKLRKNAKEANINLHVTLPSKDGRLNFSRICKLVPNWQSADIWFCGPAGFGTALKNDAIASGISANDFHQELFEMR